MKWMKYFLPALFLLYFAGAPAQDKKRVVIASTPDPSIDDNIRGLFIDELGQGLTRSGKYIVIQNRDEAAKIFGEEKEFQFESGLVADEQSLVSEMGKWTGIDLSCYVTIRKIGSNYNINCKLMNIKGESIGEPFSLRTRNGEDDLIDVAIAMAQRLATGRDVTVNSQASNAVAPKCCYNDYSRKYVDCNISRTDEEARSYKEAVEFCKKKGEGWRLPTKDELAIIYQNRIIIVENQEGKGRFSSSDYWSSSMRNNYEGYIVNFSTGQEHYYSVNIKNVFRCVQSD